MLFISLEVFSSVVFASVYFASVLGGFNAPPAFIVAGGALKPPALPPFL